MLRYRALLVIFTVKELRKIGRGNGLSNFRHYRHVSYSYWGYASANNFLLISISFIVRSKFPFSGFFFFFFVFFGYLYFMFFSPILLEKTKVPTSAPSKVEADRPKTAFFNKPTL